VFRLEMRMQQYSDGVQYYCRLIVWREDRERLCGIITLHGLNEWAAFQKILEAIRIPVTDATAIPPPAAEAAEDDRERC